MNRWTRWSYLVAGVLLLSNTFTVPMAWGGPIPPEVVTEIRGEYAGITPPTGTLEPSFTLTAGTTTLPPSVGVRPVSDLTVDVTICTLFFSCAVALNPTEIPNPRFIILAPDLTTMLAVFDISNPAVLSPFDPLLGTGMILAGASFDPGMSVGIPGVDPSLLNALEVMLTNISIVPDVASASPAGGEVFPAGGGGTATWPFPGGSVTVSWRLFIAPVPEPASLSLVIGGVVSLLGIGWFKRRRTRGACHLRVPPG